MRVHTLNGFECRFQALSQVSLIAPLSAAVDSIVYRAAVEELRVLETLGRSGPGATSVGQDLTLLIATCWFARNECSMSPRQRVTAITVHRSNPEAYTTWLSRNVLRFI